MVATTYTSTDLATYTEQITNRAFLLLAAGRVITYRYAKAALAACPSLELRGMEVGDGEQRYYLA